MIFWLRFALRSVLRRRRRTLITFLAVGFGIAMLIVLGSIMVGVNDTMVENAVSLRAGQLLVEAPATSLSKALQESNHWQQQAETAAVEQVLPRLTIPGVIRQGQQLRAIQLQLVDAAAELQRSPVPGKLVVGHWLTGESGLVLGDTLADELGLSPGDQVDLMTTRQHYHFPLLGTFRTGIQPFDQGIGYFSLNQAAQFAAEQTVQLEMALFVSPGRDLVHLRQQLQHAGGPSGKVVLWQEKLPEVEQLVKLNEFSMQVMILLVIAILAFGIANSLLLSVMDRYRYFAILKAIGVRPRELVITVIGESLVISLGAGLLGTLFGVVISLIWGQIGLDLGHYTSFNPHFSMNSVIYPRLVLSMVLLPQGLALLVGVLASFWPALVAARRSVSRGMRDL